MKNTFEQNNIPPSMLDEEDFKEFVEFREIDSADFSLIESLSRLPKKLFLDYHNYFGFSGENTIASLEKDLLWEKEQLEKFDKSEQPDSRLIELTRDRIKFIGLFLEMAKKYDYHTCMNLNSIFERRGRKK
jgi:hypothetical protein